MTQLTRLYVADNSGALDPTMVPLMGWDRAVGQLTGLLQLGLEGLQFSAADSLHLSVLTGLTDLWLRDAALSDMALCVLALSLTNLVSLSV